LWVGQQVSDLGSVKVKLTSRPDKMLLVVCFKLVLGSVLLASSDRDFADDLRSALTRSDDLDAVPYQAIKVRFAPSLNCLETIDNPIGEGEACLVSDV
jgi:hypothetical protein